MRNWQLPSLVSHLKQLIRRSLVLLDIISPEGHPSSWRNAILLSYSHFAILSGRLAYLPGCKGYFHFCPVSREKKISIFQYRRQNKSVVKKRKRSITALPIIRALHAL